KAAANNYTICVFDSQGNKRTAAVAMTPVPGQNRAPVPYVTVQKSKVSVGEMVSVRPSLSYDQDNSIASCMVEWDFDGDDVFEVGPTAYNTAWVNTTYATPGSRLI